MLTIQRVHPSSRLRLPRAPRLAHAGVLLRLPLLAACLVWPFGVSAPAPWPSRGSPDGPPIAETLAWIHRPSQDLMQFDYAMTVRIRFLFFWVSKDDVGGGYIRRGIPKDEPRLELFQVLFGSDPAKTPKQINRWGAGTEAVWHNNSVSQPAASSADDVAASAFFGFMKSSKGKSVSEMQAELKREKDQGDHAFTGILSRVEPGRAFSLIVPLTSSEDFNLHQYDTAEPLMIEKLSTSEQPARTLADSGRCPRAGEFLGTVAELMDTALKSAAPARGSPGSSALPQPAALCYIHDAQVNILTLAQVEPVKKLQAKINAAKGGLLADNTFEDLLQLDFVTTHELSGKKVYFTLLVGTQGALRGVPVQIRYEPNWWFQVVLNLQPRTSRLVTASK